VVSAALFAGLVDDAALFPPGNAPMRRGLAEHEQHRRAWYSDVIGPFLCPASRAEELLDTLPGDQKLDLALVVDATGDIAHQALKAVAADPRLSLVTVEAAHARLGADTAAVGANLTRLPGVTGYLEVARDRVEEGLAVVTDTGWHAAKFRTGGTHAAAFPDERGLARFLVATVTRSVPFKLTAGLHHAVRHTDATTGFEHHGVLNALVATRVAVGGGSGDEVAAVLAERDPSPLVAAVRGWDDSDVAAVRTSFWSLGCCGVTDPVDDLVSLGLLAGATQ